jgi:hypothetical protein
MKPISAFPILIIILLVDSSCGHNRLKTNEEELKKEILAREKESQETIMNAPLLPDTSARGIRSLRYKGDRSVDPSNPPLIIDLEANLDNIIEVKLSEVVSGIRYIAIEQPPDSAFTADVRFDYYLTDDYIIAVNRLGILKYNQNGRFLSTVVKNNSATDGFLINSTIGASYMQGGGNYYNNIQIAGNKLYYTYVNTISSQDYRMEYNCSEFDVNPQKEFNPEFPDEIIGKGKIVADYNANGNRGEINSSGSKSILTSRSFMTKWIDNNSYAKKISRADIYAIISKEGDTLSEFPLYEKLVNYTKSVGRGTDPGCYYEFEGKTYFRNSYNDTLFHVIPPNRLLPVYVLNLGKYKTTRQQGTDPDFDLTGKIIPEEWIETEKYILLTYTKDNYDCPNTRKYKTVKIYHALYSKINHKLSVIKGDPYDYSPEILVNDLDGGLPVWPYHQDTYIPGENGEIVFSVKGKDLKERVKSEQFRSSAAPDVKKNELKQLAASVSDNQDILMIIK